MPKPGWDEQWPDPAAGKDTSCAFYRPRWSWEPENRLQAHQPVQPAYPLDIDQIPHASQMLRHPGYPVKRLVQVLLIDDPHQIQIVRVFRTGLVIHATSVYAKKFALPGNAQIRVISFNHHPLFFKPKTYNSFFFNQSFSIFNCPMASYRIAIFSSSFGCRCALSNTWEAFSRNSRFHVLIWFG